MFRQPETSRVIAGQPNFSMLQYGHMPRADSKDNIVAYYDQAKIDYVLVWHLSKQLAMHYGFWGKGVRTLRQALANENAVLAQMANITADDYVLDAGCGAGGSSLFLARTIGCKVAGISIVKSQIETARAAATRRGLAELATFRTADFTDTPFPDETFDVVWAIESVCHAHEKRDFLREAHRVLKPGGRLIVADGFAKQLQYDGWDKHVMDRWLHGWAVESLDRIQDFCTKAESVGLTQVKSQDFTAAVMPSASRLYRLYRLGIVFDWISRKIRFRSAMTESNFRAARYQYYALAKQLACYGVVTAIKPKS